MKRRIGLILLINLLAVTAWAASAHPAPARLGSITEGIQDPVRVAVDIQGNIYVTESSRDSLRIYTSKGRLVKTLYVPGPLGVAVDPSGSIYVGSEAKKSVEIYSPDYAFSRSLAEGDLSKPNSIAIDGAGRIYVVDSLKDTVKVYEPAGAYIMSIGPAKKPMGVAVSDAAEEVYVTDRPIIQTANGPANGARIQVFDKSGTLKRSFGEFGANTGQIASPTEIAVDKAGRLYVVDSYQGAVHILDPVSGAPILNPANGAPMALYDMTVPLVVPVGVAVGKDNLAYVTSYSGHSIEVYALDGYTTMDVSPATLNYEARQFGSNPDSQTITISNSGSGVLNWTAGTTDSWITLGQTSGQSPAKGASTLTVGVNIAALAPAVYSGKVTLQNTDTGRKETVNVTLTVLPPPIVSLSNGWLTFTAKKGHIPAPQGLTVAIENIPALSWSAVVAPEAASWLAIAPASGATTAPVTVSITSKSLNVGEYTSYITILAPGAVGSGSKLMVTCTVTPTTKISVSANTPDARYTLSGPATYTGSGASWSVEDAPAGDYTITYENVPGYKRPLPQSKTLAENEEIAFSATYTSFKELAARKNIITAKGPHARNNSEVKSFKSDGSTGVLGSEEFIPLDTLFGAAIATGDIDGDGKAEIIVGAGPGAENPALVKIYTTDKKELMEFTPFEALSYGVHVAAADIDADGKAELIVAPGPGDTNPGTVRVYSYDPRTKTMIPTGIELTAHEGCCGAVAGAADTAGDQKPEIITAPGGKTTSPVTVKIWTVDTTKGKGKWTATAAKEITASIKHEVSLAGADTDGDGKEEVIIAGRNSQGNGSAIKIYKADGTEQKVALSEEAVTVAAADLDGDGKAEIIVGAEQPQAGNAVKIMSAAGETKGTMTPYADSRKGVNVAVGDLGL